MRTSKEIGPRGAHHVSCMSVSFICCCVQHMRVLHWPRQGMLWLHRRPFRAGMNPPMDQLSVSAAGSTAMDVASCTGCPGRSTGPTWPGHAHGSSKDGGSHRCNLTRRFCGLALTFEPALAAAVACGFIGRVGSNRKCNVGGAPP